MGSVIGMDFHKLVSFLTMVFVFPCAAECEVSVMDHTGKNWVNAWV